jgi:hypothetical protein
MLDNSVGAWSDYYTNGAEATWVKRKKKEDFYFRYTGKNPRSKLINMLVNRIINSRFQNLIWRYQLISGWKSVTHSQLVGESKIEVSVGEIWSNITSKTISAIDFALQNFDFDYIIRGNSSLYLDPILLEEFLNDHFGVIDYAGPVAGEKKFVSGWCIILSRKAAQIIVDDYCKRDSLYFDDEAIGLILARNGIEIQKLECKIFDRIPSASEIEYDASIGNWIWRFKNDVSSNRISVESMKVVEKTLRNPGADS